MDVKQFRSFERLFSKLTSRQLRNEEDILSHNVAVFLRNLVFEGWQLIFFHVPNEAFTSVNYAKKLNSIGRIPGAPDFIIASKSKVLFLELKAQNKKLELSEPQKAFRDWSNFAGVQYEVANSLDSVSKLVYKTFGASSGIANLGILGNA